MASFRIHNDVENNAARAKNRTFGNNQKRAVLGIVNTNAEATINLKNAVQLEKGAVKPKLINKVILGEKNKCSGKATGVVAKPKVQPFQIFEDEVERKLAVPVKQQAHARVLKEKKIDSTSVAGSSQECVALPALSVPGFLSMPEPMSPAQSADSPMCLDVSLKAESKSKAQCESALRDLDFLNLTERLYMCEEYRPEISIYLRSLQMEHRPRKNYMARQPDITYNMRAVLVDWLVEVVEEYKMTNETLYLAVSYIDRFLSTMSVVRSKLQLVGTAAMFIAAKYEEIYPPDVKDFVYITDDTYTKRQVLRMEHLILHVLHFDLSVPTALNFLCDFTAHHPTPDNVKYLAMYLCELSLLQGDPYLGYLPSDVAAGALCVARAYLLPDEDVMPPALQAVVDVQLVDLMHVIGALESTYRASESNVQQATRDKFKTDKYLRVASLPPPETDCSSLLTREQTPTPEHHHGH